VDKLSPTRLKQHYIERMAWDVVVPFGVPFEALLNPPFWAHHANSIQPGHTVFVVAQDLSYRAQLFCLDAGVGFVTMDVDWQVIDEAKASALAESIAATKDAAAKYAEPPKSFPCVDFKTATGWRIIGHDGKQVAAGLASEDKAKEELDKYIKRSAPKASKEPKTDAKAA
jgi:hypothetical protein